MNRISKEDRDRMDFISHIGGIAKPMDEVRNPTDDIIDDCLDMTGQPRIQNCFEAPLFWYVVERTPNDRMARCICDVEADILYHMLAR